MNIDSAIADLTRSIAIDLGDMRHPSISRRQITSRVCKYCDNPSTTDAELNRIIATLARKFRTVLRDE